MESPLRTGSGAGDQLGTDPLTIDRMDKLSEPDAQAILAGLRRIFTDVPAPERAARLDDLEQAGKDWALEVAAIRENAARAARRRRMDGVSFVVELVGCEVYPGLC